MTDKRNIVIKVKYPVSGKATENVAPKMVTEWNVKRILIAAGVLVLILASLFYAINRDRQETGLDNNAVIDSAVEKQETPPVEVKTAETRNLDISSQSSEESSSLVKPIQELNKKNKQTTDIAVKESIKKQPDKKVNKERGYSEDNHNVSRAALTYRIDNKEPVGEVVHTIDVSRKKPVWVYYFTELKAMKGRHVYHEWLKNGVTVSRRTLIISGNNWRTSSRRLFSDSEKGNWAVRLVDEKGRLLNEKKFNVE
jgi:hypothetical protein